MAAALLMQEQGKAEAQRVAKLRERGIAADPRPAMDMVQAEQAVDALMTAGVTGSLKALLPAAPEASGREEVPGVSADRDCTDYALVAGGLALAAGVLTFGVSWELIAAGMWAARATKAAATLNLLARAGGMYGLAECTGYI